MSAAPLGQPLLVWTDRFRKDGREISIAVAEDLTALQAQISAFRNRLALITLVLLGGLILVQRLIVRASLKPLAQVQEDCRRLERSELRKLREDVPLEVKPMVRQINHLLAVMQQRQARRRNALGNLAHALKTPLTRLSQITARDTAKLKPQTAEDLRHAVADIGELVDRELKRARLAGATVPGQRCDLARELSDLMEVIKKLYADKALTYESTLPPGKLFSGDREDVLELFGNLLDNAAKWAHRRVKVTIEDVPGLVFHVDDDGPGLDDKQAQSLLERGARLDEAAPGHGLGLAIAKEITDQYAGRLYLTRSVDLGGLRASVCLTQP